MTIPAQFQPLTKGGVDDETINASAQWLASIWEYRAKEYTFMGVKAGNRWKDISIRCDQDRLYRIADVLAKYTPDTYDIYFCPNAFDRPSRKTQYAVASTYAWCDIDENSVARYDPSPNIFWETSPGRHQGLWIWSRANPALDAQQYSCNIVYKDGGDTNGWSITKMLRLPGTINHKVKYAKPVVTLRAHDAQPQELPASLSKIEPHLFVGHGLSGTIDIEGIDPKEVIKRYRSRVNRFARTLLDAKRVIYPDRSAAIFAMVSELVRVGARDTEIASVLLINPHFVEKHGADLAMAEREIVCIRTKVEAGQ